MHVSLACTQFCTWFLLTWWNDKNLYTHVFFFNFFYWKFVYFLISESFFQAFKQAAQLLEKKTIIPNPQPSPPPTHRHTLYKYQVKSWINEIIIDSNSNEFRFFHWNLHGSFQGSKMHYLKDIFSRNQIHNSIHCWNLLEKTW